MKNASSVLRGTGPGPVLTAVAAMLLIPLPNSAAATNVLTARDAVQRAVEHSFPSRLARQEETAAEGMLRQIRAAGMPQVTLETSGGHYWMLEDFQVTPTFVIPKIEDRFGASLNLRSVLLAGGEIANRRAAAAFKLDAAKESLAAAEADTVFAALSAYWNWARAVGAVKTADAALARMTAHASDLARLGKSGLAAENDVTMSDAILAQTTLKRRDALRAAELTRLFLEHLTGKELPPDAVPEEARLPDDPPRATEEAVVAAALANRPDLRAAERDVRAAASAAKAADAGLRPRVMFSARAGAAQPNPLFFPPEQEWNPDLFAGLAAQWPILDCGMTRGKRQEADARAAQAKLKLDYAREQVVLEARRAFVNMKQALAALPVTKQALASAEKNLASASALWKAGMTRQAELLDAQSRLAEMQFAALSAEIDILIAGAALDRAVGNPREPADRTIGEGIERE